MIRALLALPLLLAGSLCAGAVPQWLLDASRRTVPPQPAGAAVVVLFDEVVQTLQPNARCTTRHRYAVRLLNRAGFEFASGTVDYLQGSGAVQAAEAWLLRAGKEIRPPKRREWTDVNVVADGAVFDESRCRAVSYGDLVIDDDVFGYETVVEERILFAQFGYAWGTRQAVLTERYVLNLPTGWTCETRIAGPQAGLVEQGADGALSWTMHDRPYRAEEPALPPRPWVEAKLMISVHPPAGVEKPVVFRSWAELTDWDLRNSAGQCDTDPALGATVRKLTEGCADTLGRIRALGRHVQQLRYVAVNRGLADGMGSRPRKATEVHAKGWGDCKDKTNLLMAMLREAGIASYSVSASVGGGRAIDEAWIAPAQFNHAITAIQVDETVTLPSAMAVPGAGRLLFFDPTDPDVLVGDLPLALQGTKVQVHFPGNTALTTLPLLPLETSHRAETRTTLALVGSGVVGKCVVGGPARTSAMLRALARVKTEKEQRTFLAELLSGGASGAQIQDMSATEEPATGERRLSFTFGVPRFGQPMPGGLLLVRLDVLGRSAVPAFPAKDRTLPVRVEPIDQVDEVVLELPAGLTVEEMPEPTELISDYGRYTCHFERTGSTVVVRRELRMEDRIVPVAEYAALRRFLADVAKADHAAVVLRSQ